MVIKLDENYNAMTSTALLGYVGETNARPVSVEGMEIDGADRYVLTIDYGDGVTYEVDITGGQWTPTADILRSAQTVSCQICAKKLSGQEYILVKKSRIFRLRIGAAIGDNAIPSPSVAADALDRIDSIGRQAHADMQTAVTAAETATTAAENAEKSATDAEKSADTAEQAASRAETAKTAAETSAAQSETARQGAENARQQAVTSQNNAKISAAQAATSAQQTTADKNITAGYAKTAKTCADSTAADRQAVADMATQVTADKATVADHAAQVAEARTAAETAAQTAQAVADSLPDDYTTAVGKIAENTAEIGRVKLSDKELQRRVNALFDIGQGITHRFETDSETAYAKTVPTGAKLMSVKSIGGHSEVIDGKIVSTGTEEIVEQGKNLWNIDGYTASDLVDLGRGYCGIKLGVSPNSAYCISVARDTALCETYGKVIGADKRDIEFFGHKTVSSINAYTGHPIKIQTADENYVYVVINSFNGFDKWKSDFLKYFPNFQIEKSSTATAYAPFHRNTYQIPEAIRNLPGYGIEGNVTDYEAKTYTQNNTVDGTEIKALDTPIVTDISALIPDDFLRNVEVEAGGSVIFKNSNDSYLIPVPSEEEYIVKLSEIGGTT